MAQKIVNRREQSENKMKFTQRFLLVISGDVCDDVTACSNRLII